MKKVLLHMTVLLSAAVLVFASCFRDEAEVIPRAKLARIYAEMLVTDQWIMSTPGVRTIADTSLVYEPILEKYGYDSDDYRKTVDVYMDDPERFAKIFRETGEILENRLKLLKEEQERLKLQMEKEKEAMKYRTDFRPDEFFPYLHKEPYVHYYDSVAFVPDSTDMVYRLVPVETSDTTYLGLEMIVKVDTLTANDTIPPLDSAALKVEEPLKVLDMPELKPELKPEPRPEPKPIPENVPEKPSKVNESMRPMRIPEKMINEAKKQLKTDVDK